MIPYLTWEIESYIYTAKNIKGRMTKKTYEFDVGFPRNYWTEVTIQTRKFEYLTSRNEAMINRVGASKSWVSCWLIWKKKKTLQMNSQVK